jgi:hypothetical protein
MNLLIQKIKKFKNNAKLAKVLWVTCIKYLNSNHIWWQFYVKLLLRFKKFNHFRLKMISNIKSDIVAHGA